MKDYKKSAKPGRPVTPQGKSVGKYAEGGAVTKPAKFDFGDAWKSYNRDTKAGVRFPWNWGSGRGGGRSTSAGFHLMGFIPYLKNYSKMQSKTPQEPKK